MTILDSAINAVCLVITCTVGAVCDLGRLSAQPNPIIYVQLCPYSQHLTMSREASSKYDKPDIRGSPEDKKALVSLILETMQSKVPKHLRLQIKDLSTTVSALGYLHPAKRYTNMYGNLNAVFSKEDFSSIVTVDSTVLVLQPIEVLRASHSAGLISDADLALCESMWKYKEEFDAETRKNVRNDVFSFRNQDSQR